MAIFVENRFFVLKVTVNSTIIFHKIGLEIEKVLNAKDVPEKKLVKFCFKGLLIVISDKKATEKHDPSRIFLNDKKKCSQQLISYNFVS